MFFILLCLFDEICFLFMHTSGYLQAQIFAMLPTNQWAQLKRALRGAPGCGLMAAMKGWMKHRIVVARPREACIVAELHSPNSTNIITKAAIVIDQVSTMKNLCHLEGKIDSVSL